MEIWKSIPGYEGCYEASNLGRIRSLTRYVNAGPGGKGRRLVIGKIKSQSKDYHGYWRVTLKKDGNKTFTQVHQLVAKAFFGLPLPGHEVAHLDGTRDNSRVENLIYTTTKENVAHKKLHGTYTYGEIHSVAKLTEVEVLDIDTLLVLGASQTQLAKEFGVCQQAISRIKCRKTWSHLPL